MGIAHTCIKWSPKLPMYCEALGHPHLIVYRIVLTTCTRVWVWNMYETSEFWRASLNLQSSFWGVALKLVRFPAASNIFHAVMHTRWPHLQSLDYTRGNPTLRCALRSIQLFGVGRGTRAHRVEVDVVLYHEYRVVCRDRQVERDRYG